MRRWLAAVAALSIFLWAAGAAVAAPPLDLGGMMPLSEVRPGMRGVTKTVVEGTRVESFDVEVLGILPDAGPAGDLIMIEVSEEMVRRAGGIAAGVSGSPVYVDDRLIGAIGFGFGFSDHRIGLVTPVEDMLPLYDQVEPGEEAGAGPRARNGARDGRVAEGVVPLQTPLLVGGLSPRAFQALSVELEKRGFAPLQMGAGLGTGGLAPRWSEAAGGSGEGDAAAPRLQPGAGLGIQLARGDVNIYALGTLTHLDGDRFIALGHPFTNRGEIAFLASEVYVHHIVRTLVSPFKIASPLNTVGSVLQDRGAGVAGRLGEEVPLVRMRVQVWDADRRKDEVYDVEIVRDEQLLVPFVSAVALSAADRALDRVGRGTARMIYRIDGEGLPRPLMRTNLTFSEGDVAGASLFELIDAVRILAENPFDDVGITEIDVVLEVEGSRETAHIEDARPLPARVFPGDTVEVDVTLRPFRREPVRERVRFQVPEDAAPGPVNVVVRAGSWAGEPGGNGHDGGEPGDARVVSLRRLLDRMMEQEQNNDLIVELFPPRRSAYQGQPDGPGADGPEGPGSGEADGDHSGALATQADRLPYDEGAHEGMHEWEAFDPASRVHASLRTPYVLSGATSFDLVIRRRGDLWVPAEPPLLAPL